MSELRIREIEEWVADALRARARRHDRSLQEELRVLLREDVLEPLPQNAQITKLDPADVLTTAQAAAALAPLIKPLPNYDEYVLGKTAS